MSHISKRKANIHTHIPVDHFGIRRLVETAISLSRVMVAMSLNSRHARSKSPRRGKDPSRPNDVDCKAGDTLAETRLTRLWDQKAPHGSIEFRVEVSCRVFLFQGP